MNEHRPLELLIPWYVNGTLHESEQDRLNRHLEACPSCREQVQREIEFSRALCETPAAMAQANRASARAELLARVAHDSGKQGPRFHIRALAAASIIAVAVLLIGIFDTKPAYRTLTVPAQGDQTVVQILFEPAIGEREIRDSLINCPVLTCSAARRPVCTGCRSTTLRERRISPSMPGNCPVSAGPTSNDEAPVSSLAMAQSASPSGAGSGSRLPVERTTGNPVATADHRRVCG